MKHRVTFTFKPVVLEVETFSGKDVAEELARHLLRAKIAEGSTPIWMADCSQATVEPEGYCTECGAGRTRGDHASECSRAYRQSVAAVCTCKCSPEEHGPGGCRTWYGDRNTGFRCNCTWRPTQQEVPVKCVCTTINFHGLICGEKAEVAGYCRSCYRNCLPDDAAE